MRNQDPDGPGGLFANIHRAQLQDPGCTIYSPNPPAEIQHQSPQSLFETLHRHQRGDPGSSISDHVRGRRRTAPKVATSSTAEILAEVLVAAEIVRPGQEDRSGPVTSPTLLDADDGPRQSRPGEWLTSIAARVYTAKEFERFLEQPVGDLQIEHLEASKGGNLWLRRWVLIRGYASIAKPIALSMPKVVHRIFSNLLANRRDTQ